MAKFVINSAQDLLGKKAFEALTPAEQKEYLAVANAYIAQFNADHPDGLALSLNITAVQVNGERPGFEVEYNPNLSTTYFGMGFTVMSAIAENLGAGDMFTLKSVITMYAFDAQNRPKPAQLKVRVKGVTTKDTYLQDGVQKPYKCPQIVSMDREVVVLPEAAVDYLAVCNDEANRAAIKNSRIEALNAAKAAMSRRSPAGTTSANVNAPAGEEVTP